MRIADMAASAAADLRDAGVQSPVLDAELIISHALGMERIRVGIDADRELTAAEIRRIQSLLRRRRAFEPIAYILGRKEFYSLDFMVTRDVLIPRPETELLVDLAVYYARQNGAVVDIGTGSGAIAVSVKHSRPDIEMHATDISERALRVARKNAAAILGPKKIRFHSGDLFEPLQAMKFQVIAANPPYVNRDDAARLQKDLSYEPEIALFADREGRGTVERIVAGAAAHLSEGGILLFEIGADMKECTENTGRRHGFSVSVMNDYAGLPRVAVMKL